MTRILISLMTILFSCLYMEAGVLVYETPAEKTYVDTSCCRIKKLDNGQTVYEVAYITIYTAIQSNGTKKVIYIEQYNSTWNKARIIHTQSYNEYGNLIDYSNAYRDWFYINNGTIAATMRDKVRQYF